MGAVRLPKILVLTIDAFFCVGAGTSDVTIKHAGTDVIVIDGGGSSFIDSALRLNATDGMSVTATSFELNQWSRGSGAS